MMELPRQPEIKTDNLNKETKTTMQNDDQQMEFLPSQDEKAGVFGLKSMSMYIPICAVTILGVIVKGSDSYSLTMKIILGYLGGFVIWLIAALVGYFDKKD